ncbi:MAG: OmpP1/FadL family transporter [Hyphomicrobiaceae bacterium]
MRIHLKKLRTIGGAAGVLLATTALMTPALAGGFAVREQSTEFQGMSFAGSAAGGALSSMFWNSAALGGQGWGLLNSSNYAYIIADSEITVLPGTSAALGGVGTSVDIGRDAIVPADYYSYRLSKDMVIGLGINAPFGLGTEVNNPNWAGQFHHRSSKMVTYNFNPTLAYQLHSGLWVGVGLQVEYMSLRLKQAASPLNLNTAVLKGDDIGVGVTAGIMWEVHKGTTFGLGWRSSVEHSISDGESFVNGSGAPKTAISTSLSTPDIVTFSFRHALHANTRLLGTVEWTNWSKFGTIPVTVNATGATLANLDFQWHDGWLFALGGEYDWSDRLTLRAGVAYELSPIQNATERILQVPDSDRWWLSMGASYKYSETTTLDFAYTHIFFDGGAIDRTPAAVGLAPLNLRLVGESDQSADILSFAIKMKLGGGAPAHHEPLK